MHNVKNLITLFNGCFFDDFNTLLQGGANEPIYLPSDDQFTYNRIVFTKDYYASALHEIAHWCVAGDERRKLIDYGYWYEPDGRSKLQQAEFERVEVKPQALEWLFTRAVGGSFKVSADNLALNLGSSEQFKRSIAEQAQKYCRDGLSMRPSRLIAALQSFYGVDTPYNSSLYRFENL